MTQMAISSYLGWLILLAMSYPFLLVFISIATYEPTRSKAIFLCNAICAVLAMVLLFLHMNIEVVYGKELLDAWHHNNPN